MRASLLMVVGAQLLAGCASDAFTTPNDASAADAALDATLDGAMTDALPSDATIDAVPGDGGIPRPRGEPEDRTLPVAER